MTESKSERTKLEAKAARAAREAEREAEERRAADELLNRRTAQLENAQRAVTRLQEDLCVLRKSSASHRELSSHLDGFYEEIDKLTKGKALMEVTPLMLEQVNDVIRDSKAMVKGDTYLDRIKEFVSAGNNPLYPDVLVTLRALQQVLERFEENLHGREVRLKEALTRGRTIAAGLEFYLETDEEGEAPTKGQIKAIINSTAIDESCFSGHTYDNGYFDFDLLDSRNLDEYLSGTAGREGGEEEEQDEK